MVLILTVGGVSALLGRNVFQPIKTLTDFTDRAADGTLMDSFPKIEGELGNLAENFRKLILRHHEAVANQKRQSDGLPAETGGPEKAPD
jgi:methyl-accepting chemotaxis protein